MLKARLGKGLDAWMAQHVIRCGHRVVYNPDAVSMERVSASAADEVRPLEIEVDARAIEAAIDPRRRRAQAATDAA